MAVHRFVLQKTKKSHWVIMAFFLVVCAGFVLVQLFGVSLFPALRAVGEAAALPMKYAEQELKQLWSVAYSCIDKQYALTQQVAHLESVLAQTSGLQMGDQQITDQQTAVSPASAGSVINPQRYHQTLMIVGDSMGIPLGLQDGVVPDTLVLSQNQQGVGFIGRSGSRFSSVIPLDELQSPVRVHARIQTSSGEGENGVGDNTRESQEYIQGVLEHFGDHLVVRYINVSLPENTILLTVGDVEKSIEPNIPLVRTLQLESTSVDALQTYKVEPVEHIVPSKVVFVLSASR
jgi:hypothetical protein